MITSNIKVNETSWQAGQEELKKLRSQVAIQNGLSPAQAFDVYDNKAIHFIAYDDQHTPIGCCRLADDGRISRPQILLTWQLKGIENCLIEAVVKYAKSKTELSKLTILEDVRIAPYYVHFGFRTEGIPVTDQGLPAQLMTYEIKRETKIETETNHPSVFHQAPKLKDIDEITQFDSKESYLEALLQVASHSQRTIKIYSPVLPPEAFGDKRLLKIFSDHCRRSRYTEIQVLVISEKSLVTGSHGLRSLYEKLPSSISIRKLVPADDEIDFREYLISDDGHMTVRARTRTISGELSANRSEIAKQLTAFDEFWMKSRSIADLRLTTY